MSKFSNYREIHNVRIIDVDMKVRAESKMRLQEIITLAMIVQCRLLL